jgi:hypothetical protein
MDPQANKRSGRSRPPVTSRGTEVSTASNVYRPNVTYTSGSVDAIAARMATRYVLGLK